MKCLKDLIKKSFDLWVRTRWLKEIEKETKKRDKLFEKYKRSQYVISELFKEYTKLYPETLTDEKGGE